MRSKKESSSNRLHPDTISYLFTRVFPDLSDMAIFNLDFFCVITRTEADEQFRKALDLEMFRRGLATTPNPYTRDFKVDKFSDDDMESVDMWFAGDGHPDGYTHEDHYVKLFTGRDRWAERKRKLRAARKVSQNRTKS